MLNSVSSITHIINTVPNHYANILQFFQKKNIRLPAICILCNQYHYEKHAICANCNDFLIPIGHSCRICSIPLANIEISICNSCSLCKPYVDKVFTGFLYEEPLRSLLHKFKYQHSLYLTSLLTEIMLQAKINERMFQCLIPVPIHKKRLQERGFNQAAVLAMHLSKIIKVPYDIKSCRKIINTPSQASLKSKERKINLINAFSVRDLKYKEVTLIDDLMTTGSTANEIAKTLKENGVHKVYLWCCARATSNFSSKNKDATKTSKS
ncbi:MAG: ComF family protein [Legionellaceae bacterium]|nr:ComF family protein [Legionellaceae bacterium]